MLLRLCLLICMLIWVDLFLHMRVIENLEHSKRQTSLIKSGNLSKYQSIILQHNASNKILKNSNDYGNASKGNNASKYCTFYGICNIVFFSIFTDFVVYLSFYKYLFVMEMI